MKNTVHWTRDYNDEYKIMTSRGQNVSRSRWLIAAGAVVVMFLLGGCGDILSTKHTRSQVDRTISDLRQVKEISDPNISVPDIYKQPPEILEQIVGGEPEYKLFYFCLHHISDELKQRVHEQFATKLFDKKGKETKLVDYTVSSVAATNQLIVRCPAREDAEAVLAFLQRVDVPPIQVKIDCLISEVYADRTLDWETTLEIEDLFGEGITAGGSARRFGTDIIQQLIVEGNPLPAFPGGSLRELGRSKMGLKVGYLSKSENFLAMVDLLESKGYLKVLMHPTLEVVNGKTARISTKEHMPLQETYINRLDSDWFESKIEYYDVISSLEITPHVFAGNYIGLETKIILGSKNTPEGIKQVSIITEKEIQNEENRIRPGESLVIGGIRKCEQRDVIRGIPFLKDLPLIGFLFSSRDSEERVFETIFILTPTISTGGMPTEEVLEEVRRRHESPTPETLHEAVMGAFGIDAHKAQTQRQARQAEQSRLEAQAEKAHEHERGVIRQAEARAERAEAELKKVKAEVQQIKADAEKSKEEAERAEAEKPQEEADAKSETEESKEDAEKAKAEEDNAEPEA